MSHYNRIRGVASMRFRRNLSMRLTGGVFLPLTTSGTRIYVQSHIEHRLWEVISLGLKCEHGHWGLNRAKKLFVRDAHGRACSFGKQWMGHI